jgi:hypothetical protein
MGIVILSIPLISITAWFIATRLGRSCAKRLGCAEKSAMRALAIAGFVSMGCVRFCLLWGAPLADALPLGWCAFILGMILFGLLLIVASWIINVLRNLDG